MKFLSIIVVVLSVFGSEIVARAQAPVQKSAAEIDGLLESHWKSRGVSRDAPITDEVFVRRIYLDLAGRIPTGGEALDFLQSTKTDKRALVIDKLLQQESYVSNFYNFWADILRYKSRFTNTANVVPAAYRKFITESLRANKPFDQFVRQMLLAKGYAWDNGAVGYYERDPGMPLDNMALTARVFLGTRIECAQCHNHPFDKWKQTEFYHLAAYTFGNEFHGGDPLGGAREAIRARQDAIQDDFRKEKAASTDGGKAAEQRKAARLQAMEYRTIVGIIKGPVGQLFSPIALDRHVSSALKLPHDFKESDGKPFEIMKPAAIMGSAADVAPGQDPAEVFADWATSPANPCFTKVIVNRLWKKMFGVALIEPLDELRDDTTAMIPSLEAYLEKLMVAQHYDMRAFLAVIANTNAYQSAVTRDEFARGSDYHFTGPVLRRMTAEQTWDSIVALSSYEPDARDFQRESSDDRRINVSKMACEAYINFGGKALVDLAYAQLAAEDDLAKREKVVKEALIIAKRNGDKGREIELRHQEGALDKERGESYVKNFIMPMLVNLSKKAAIGAAPVVDASYKMNQNPRVIPTETWKRMYVPGYGPAPKTPVHLEAEARLVAQRYTDLAERLGVSQADRSAFVVYCQNAQTQWLRASELESPAPRGHFLRTMGQSDRDFIENANPMPSIPQALQLMNGQIAGDKGLMAPFSPLMMFVNREKSPESMLNAVYLSLLSRRPTPGEVAIWSKASESNSMSASDFIYAILNTKQFVFIQ